MIAMFHSYKPINFQKPNFQQDTIGKKYAGFTATTSKDFTDRPPTVSSQKRKEALERESTTSGKEKINFICKNKRLIMFLSVTYTI